MAELRVVASPVVIDVLRVATLVLVVAKLVLVVAKLVLVVAKLVLVVAKLVLVVAKLVFVVARFALVVAKPVSVLFTVLTQLASPFHIVPPAPAVQAAKAEEPVNPDSKAAVTKTFFEDRNAVFFMI